MFPLLACTLAAVASALLQVDVIQCTLRVLFMIIFVAFRLREEGGQGRQLVMCSSLCSF